MFENPVLIYFTLVVLFISFSVILINLRGKFKDSRKEYKNAISKYIPGNTSYFLSDGLVEIEKIHLIYVLVECGDVIEFSQSSAKIIEIIDENNGSLISNLSGLMQITFDSESLDYQPILREISTRISQSLNDRTRILICSVRAMVGTVGIPSRKSWGIYPVNFSLILKILLEVQPGSINERFDL